MNEIHIKDFLKNKKEYLKKNGTVFGFVDKISILAGNGLDRNKSYNYEIYETHTKGGIIICFPEDISFVNIRNDNYTEFGKDFLNNFKNFLETRISEHKIIIEENDVLVDGIYKVCSFMSSYVEDKLYTAFHFSMEVDINIISEICTKPMKKIPKGLKDYGIKRKEIIEWINKQNL